MAEIDWKDRAINRRLENKKLKKTIKEITTSRDFWKVKAIERSKKLNELEDKMTEIKKNFQKIMNL